MDNSAYMDAITAEGSLLLTEEEQLAGAATISLETQERGLDFVTRTVALSIRPLVGEAIGRSVVRSRPLIYRFVLFIVYVVDYLSNLPAVFETADHGVYRSPDIPVRARRKTQLLQSTPHFGWHQASISCGPERDVAFRSAGSHLT